MNRTAVLERLRSQIRAGRSIPFEVAHADENGVLQFSDNDHLAFVYHTSRFPKANLAAGLLPLTDANGTVLDLAKTSPPSGKPLIAGLCGNDPFRLMDKLLQEIKNAGFVGVQNFPSLGVMDGGFRSHLERSQLGYAREVEMILAASTLDLLTMPLVFNAEDSLQMLEAGADVLVLHPGAKAFRKDFPMKEFVKGAAKIAERIKAFRHEALVLRYTGGTELVPASMD